MSDEPPAINLYGVMLDTAGVMAALHERAAQIAGELDRVRIDCELPCLADTVSRSARELHEDILRALENRPAPPHVVPGLFNAFDALIGDLARVESCDDADEGFPTGAQGRTLLRYLRFTFRDDAPPHDRGTLVSLGEAGSPASVLVVRLADGSTVRIDRDGRLST